jgi:hypothetical protein
MNALLVWQGESATAGVPAKYRVVGTRTSVIGRWRYRQPILHRGAHAIEVGSLAIWKQSRIGLANFPSTPNSTCYGGAELGTELLISQICFFFLDKKILLAYYTC